MERAQPTLHEAIRLVLLDQPDHAATPEVIAAENTRLDLYRRKDQQHPETWRVKRRATNYHQLFDVLDGGRIWLKR